MTRSVTLYIEEIQDGRGFMQIVGEVAGRKPVVAVKSGSSRKGKAAASSHTGSLAGSYEVYIAAFRQAGGVIPARSLRDAFNLAELLASEGYPRGKRAIAVTSAGGFAVLASDYAEAYGSIWSTSPPTTCFASSMPSSRRSGTTQTPPWTSSGTPTPPGSPPSSTC